MADNCTTRAFAGCSCASGECQSASARLAEINHKIKTVEAKRRAGLAMLTYGAVLCAGVSLILLSFVLVGLPEMQRWEKINQERISWNR